MLMILVATLGGCTGEDTHDSRVRDEPDAGLEDIGSEDVISTDTIEAEDILVLGDVTRDANLGHRCGNAVVEDWPLNTEVADARVTTSEQGGVMHATIDARAGGTRAAASKSYIYLDLESGAQLLSDDVRAFKEGGWDLAFKRVIIRSNGADSGQSDISVSKLSDTRFEAVSAAPAGADAWAQDVTYDADCALITDPIGQPVTAFNYLNLDNPSGSQSWYDYGNGIVPHPGDIYVIKVPARQATYKLELLSWDDGIFEVRWAAL